MALILALFFSLIVAADINKTTEKAQIEKVEIQVSAKKPTVKEIIETIKPKPIKEEVKPIQSEPIKEKVKPVQSEPIKEKVKSIKPEPIKEVAKIDSKEPELIKEEVKEASNLNEDKTDWLKLAFYALGFILFIFSGKYIYSRFQKNSSTSSSSSYMRREFKEEVEKDTTDQEPTEEETRQSDTTDQEPAVEDEDSNKQ